MKLGPALREGAAGWPSSELFLVTHRALRQVPRVRVVWESLVARFGEGQQGPAAASPTVMR